MRSALIQELERTVAQIDHQIDAIRREFEYGPYGSPSKNPDDVYHMKDRQGNYLMAPLLAAKASCLSGIAMLESTRKTVIINRKEKL